MASGNDNVQTLGEFVAVKVEAANGRFALDLAKLESVHLKHGEEGVLYPHTEVGLFWLDLIGERTYVGGSAAPKMQAFGSIMSWVALTAGPNAGELVLDAEQHTTLQRFIDEENARAGDGDEDECTGAARKKR